MTTLARLFLAVSIAVLAFAHHAAAQTCTALPSTSVCYGVIPTVNVTISGSCSDAQEAAVSSLPNILAVINNTECQANLAALSCARAFPTCSLEYPCASLCNATRISCGTTVSTLLTTMGISLDCDTMPTTSCYAPSVQPTVVPSYPACSTVPSTDAMCGTILSGHEVYVPAGSTVSSLSTSAAQLGALLSFLPSSAAGTTCKQQLRKQVCSNVFLGCTTSIIPALGIAAPVPFPRFQCRGDCAAYKAACVDTGLITSTLTAKFPTAALDFMMPNCTAVGEKVPAGEICGVATGVAGLEDFPINATIYAATTVLPVLTVSCSNDLPAASSVDTTATALAALASTSFCANILPTSYTSSVNVFGGCQDYQEDALSSMPQLMSALTDSTLNLSSSCATSVAQFACVQAFPNSAGQPACASMCTTVLTDCAALSASTLYLLEKLLGLDCTALTTTDCYAPSTTETFTPTYPTPPRCLNYTTSGGSLCSEIVDYSFYLPEDTTFAELEGAVASLSFLYNFIPTIDSPTGAACYRAFTRQLCTNVFLGCDDQVINNALSSSLPGVNAPLPFPRFASRADCQNYTAACGSVIPSTYLALLPTSASFLSPNCTGSGVKYPAGSDCGVLTGVAALDDFPVSHTTFPSSSTLLPALVTQVNSIAASKVSAIALVSHCPYPLLAPIESGDEVSDGVACAMPCPYASYSAEEYKDTDAFTTAFSIISVIFNGFLLVTWLLFDSKRKQVYVLNFCFNVFMLTLSLLIGVMATHARPSRIGCKTETRTLSQANTSYFCPWQAAFIQIFSLSAAFWWSIIAIDLCLLLVLGLRLTKAQTKIKTMIYFAWGTGLPIILALIVVSQGGMKHSSTLSWCFIDNEPAWMQWVTYWAPMLFTIILGAAGLLSLFVTLVKSSRLTGNSKKSGQWRQYVRPLLFLGEFCCVFAFVLSFKFNATDHNALYDSSLRAYITCLLGSNGGVALCGSHAAERPTVAFWRLMHFGLAAQGFLNWLVYGTQKDSYVLWWSFCFRNLGFSQKGSRGSTSEADTNNATTRNNRQQMERAATGVELKNGSGLGRELNNARSSSGRTLTGSRPGSARDLTQLADSSSVSQPPVLPVRPVARAANSLLSPERLTQPSSSMMSAMITPSAASPSRLVSQLTAIGTPQSPSGGDLAPIVDSPKHLPQFNTARRDSEQAPRFDRPATPPPSSYSSAGVVNPVDILLDEIAPVSRAISDATPRRNSSPPPPPPSS